MMVSFEQHLNTFNRFNSLKKNVIQLFLKNRFWILASIIKQTYKDSRKLFQKLYASFYKIIKQTNVSGFCVAPGLH